MACRRTGDYDDSIRSPDEVSGSGVGAGEISTDFDFEAVDRGESPVPRYFSDLAISSKDLEYIKTAPRRSNSSERPSAKQQFIVSQLKNIGKSEISSYDWKLDKLSASEKQNIVENLVKTQKDGVIHVDVAQDVPVASELLEIDSIDSVFLDVPSKTSSDLLTKPIPRLTIVMLVVGTRGDVQPFVALARKLQEFGHRVRLATHADYHSFVKLAGVDFYPLGGDPRILCGFMARNKGLLTSAPAEISIQKKQMKAIIHSLLPACTEPDPDTGVQFKAQAIIANPPAYGHAHIAEALGVPIQIFFTMPWTPTSEFPHCFLRIPQSVGYRLSFLLVDLVIWWVLGDLINDFRTKTLKLSPVAYFSTYHVSITHLPTAYMWSPHLLPKPHDWGPLVDVVGNCFLDLGLDYRPTKELREWLEGGPKPIYVGFGSMPLEDASGTFEMVIAALKQTGQRGIISKGWGNLVTTQAISDEIYQIEECPHEWLFLRCTALVHHGGAGTTATGLRAGCPTAVVAFFGDQFIWGEKIHEKGLGPLPIPISQLNAENLSKSIRFLLNPEVRSRAAEFSELIAEEDGVGAAMEAFHRHLPPQMPIPQATDDGDEHAIGLCSFLAQVRRWCCLPFLP
ncbi:sterol 3-beta-glucosyltransferase UGT80B1-like isoform X2 [Wolffia australiana]